MRKITKLPNGSELIETNSGSKYYFLNGKNHREDGPAVEYANGDKSWYLNDIQVFCETQEEFERLMRLKAFW
jgi:hypothetical protein